MKNIAFMHESGVAIILGAVFGLIIYYTSGYVIPFSESSFFYFVLPPIIFAAGYTLRRRNFIRNLPFIISLGLLGTFISMTILTLLIIYTNDWKFGSLPHD